MKVEQITITSDINTSTEEGKMFLAAVAYITTMYATNKEPDVVIGEIRKLKEAMFKKEIINH